MGNIQFALPVIVHDGPHPHLRYTLEDEMGMHVNGLFVAAVVASGMVHLPTSVHQVKVFGCGHYDGISASDDVKDVYEVCTYPWFSSPHVIMMKPSGKRNYECRDASLSDFYLWWERSRTMTTLQYDMYLDICRHQKPTTPQPR